MTQDSDWQSLLTQFLYVLKKQDLMPKTLSSYQHDLELFMRWVLSINQKRQISGLTKIDLIEYRQHMMDRGLRPATINRRIGSLKRFCRWLVDRKLLKYDISKSVKQVSVSSKRAPSGLKPSEVQLLLQAVGHSKHGHAKRNYALLHLMLQTGLRVQEVAQLKVRDVEVNERSGMVFVKSGKGRKARDIPLNTKARRALNLYLEARNPETEDEPLFLSERRTGLTDRSIQAIIKELANRAGIQRVRVSPHTLRHTFAIRYLAQNPTNIVQLASLMGHESLDTTAIYTHPSLEDLAENLELMGAQ